ncbi:invasion associated locus B family protein [Methylobacterium sp. J-026]|uniref:invasion associated locus B family protein n=1 Tax=Methylobacterium sp. J-026 TaxID=2836624 RepID=UPI001FBBCDA3|nr:invasion associated locus B family protein [Methylobacterium sp. J-026]MCJ2133683.1 invasion associated locus B family protein [Methylobacterium sp. J-026]
MPTIRAFLRLSLTVTLLLAVPLAAARAQDAEPEAAAPADAPPKARPKPRPKPVAPKTAVKPAPVEAKPAAADAAPAAAASAPAHAAWPTGASTVSESYGDWTMTCTRPSEKITCIVAQSQGDSQTGRRKFGFELQTPANGRSEGIVLMPFGLSIEPGVTFKLDEQALGKGAPYTACGPDGCFVPISFPTLALDGMRAAKTLFVIGQKSGGSDAATITVPLEGFARALDRAVALSG